MQADLPHTLYDFKKRDGVSKECEDLNRRALEESRKRRGKNGKSFTLDEVFNGAADA